MKITGKIFLYITWTIAALLIFLYLRFPSDLVKDIVIGKFSQTQSGLAIKTQKIQPAIPFGLSFKPLDLYYEDFKMLSTPRFKVSSGLLSLVSEQKNIDFSAPISSGGLIGRVELSTGSKRPHSKLTLSINNVPMEELAVFNQWPAYLPGGEINAHINYDSKKGSGGTTYVKLDSSNAKISFNPPIMGLKQLDFSQLEAEMTITPRILQIRRGEAGGAQIDARISGSIIFQEPIEESRVTLSCTIKPQPTFLDLHKNDVIGSFLASESAKKRGIVVRITGTLANPKYVTR
ncbi:MAG: type II secretion system protein GspN [Desulfobacteraceae bacterium]|nr:type II secretion system protein GspN [Desulfobacteraceae bacterium]